MYGVNLIPKKKRYHSKSRIDFVLVSNNLLSNLSNVKIIHFPFSDHDIVCTKIKMNEIKRGPGVWVINENTIKSDIFKKAFNTFWTNNVSKINLYHNMKEWWDITKYKLKAFCIQISSKLNTSKKKLKIMETKLEYLKSKNDDSHMKILLLQNKILKMFMKRKLNQLYSDQKVNGTKEEEKNLQNIFLNWKNLKSRKTLG